MKNKKGKPQEIPRNTASTNSEAQHLGVVHKGPGHTGGDSKVPINKYKAKLVEIPSLQLTKQRVSKPHQWIHENQRHHIVISEFRHSSLTFLFQ